MNLNDPGETDLGALEREAFVQIGQAGCDRLEDIGVTSLGVGEAGGVYEEGVGVWDGVDLHFWGTFVFVAVSICFVEWPISAAVGGF